MTDENNRNDENFPPSAFKAYLSPRARKVDQREANTSYRSVFSSFAEDTPNEERYRGPLSISDLQVPKKRKTEPSWLTEVNTLDINSPKKSTPLQTNIFDRSLDRSMDRSRGTFLEESSYQMDQDLQSELDEGKQKRRLAEEKTHLLEKELKDWKSRVNNLDARNRDLSSQLSVQEEEVKEREFQLERMRKKNGDLKKKFQRSEDEKEELEKNLEEKDAEISAAVSKVKERMKELEEDKRSLQEQLADSEEEKAHWKSRLDSQRIELQQRELSFTTDTESLQDELDQWKAKYNLATSKISLLEETVRNAESNRSSFSESDSKLQAQLSEAQIINKSLQGELQRYQVQERQYSSAVRELGYLKDQLQNAEILKEQIRGLETKLQRSEQMQQTITSLQLELETIRSEKKKWDEMWKGLEQYETPTQVALKINELQKENQILREKEGAAHSESTRQSLSAKGYEEELDKLKKRESSLQGQLNDVQLAFKRQEKSMSILKKERDGLKSILDSYDAEDAGSDNYDTQRVARIQELERAIAEKDAHVQYLETSLDPSQKNQELETLQVNNAKLNKEIEQLVREISILESRLGKGDYNPSTTKILHLRMNPESQIQNERQNPDVEKLRQENQALQSQLALLKGDAGPSSAPQVDPKVKEDLKKAKEENENLKQKSEDDDRRMQKLKEVFKKKIVEFREMIYILFGYKIDVVEKRYRLHSRYAEQESDDILFQKSVNGQLDLLETEFTASLDEEALAFLTRCHSIPAFLSNITLDLFNKQTFNPGML